MTHIEEDVAIAPRVGRTQSPALLFIVGLILVWSIVAIKFYFVLPGQFEDFHDFYQAARIDGQGIDPYTVLAYKTPPPFALLLRPLAALPESRAVQVWRLLLMASVFLGTYCGLRAGHLSRYWWPRRRRLCAALLVVISPVSLFAYRLGQNAPLVLLSMGLAIAALARGRPLLAGFALSIGFVKPHIAVPADMVIILAAPSRLRIRVVGGMMCATVGWVLLTLLMDGGLHAYEHWLHQLLAYAGSAGGRSLYRQLDIASIPGIYYVWVPPPLARWLDLICLSAAIVGVLWLAGRARPRAARATIRLYGAGTAWYLAVTPFAHTSDQLLLVLPLLLLLGPDAAGVWTLSGAAAALGCVIVPIIMMDSYHTEGVQIAAPLLMMFAYLAHFRTGARNEDCEGYDR